MTVLLLCILLLCLLIFSFCIFNKDIFSPSVLFSFSYFLSGLCCLVNAEKWGVKLNPTTIFIIIISLMFFIIGELFVRVLINKKSNINREFKIKFIKRYGFLIISIGVDLIITYLLFKEVQRVAYISYKEWGNLIYNFKTNLSNGYEINVYVNQLLKLSKAFAYVFLYIFVNNLFAKNKKKKDITFNFLNLIPFIIVSLQSILKGVRIQIIAMIFAFAFFLYIFAQIKHQWRYKIKIKTIIFVAITGIFACVVFYNSKEVVGRLQDDQGTFGYVTTYLGGPIALLNIYIEKGIVDNNVIETMGGLVSSLQKIGLFSGYTINEIREYRMSMTGYSLGNVYGAIRDYYHDLGMFGVILWSLFDSVIVNVIYIKIKQNSKNNIHKPTLLIVYSTLVYAVFFLPFSDFLTAKLAFGSIVEIFILVIVSHIILNKMRLTSYKPGVIGVNNTHKSRARLNGFK